MKRREAVYKSCPCFTGVRSWDRTGSLWGWRSEGSHSLCLIANFWAFPQVSSGQVMYAMLAKPCESHSPALFITENSAGALSAEHVGQVHCFPSNNWDIFASIWTFEFKEFSRWLYMKGTGCLTHTVPRIIFWNEQLTRGLLKIFFTYFFNHFIHECNNIFEHAHSHFPYSLNPSSQEVCVREMGWGGTR